MSSFHVVWTHKRAGNVSSPHEQSFPPVFKKVCADVFR